VDRIEGNDKVEELDEESIDEGLVVGDVSGHEVDLGRPGMVETVLLCQEDVGDVKSEEFV